MHLGLHTFAALPDPDGPRSATGAEAVAGLLARVERAEAAGLHHFGIGEHHRAEFLDSAPHVLLAAAAARTSRIRLTSAVTVLSAADPVRAFQNYAAVDLVSGGRAEMVVGRGSFTEAFPLFGYGFDDYDALFEEKLGLLLRLRDEERVTWSGRFRPPLRDQGVYPRPAQAKLPIWVGVGGTPQSFVRAGTLGLPLMVAIIGGEPHRFAPLVDLYREAGRRAGHNEATLRVGVHAIGYVGVDDLSAREAFFPGYRRQFSRIGRERGWGAVTREHFDAVSGPTGALVVGGPEEVATKIRHYDEVLGGLDRFSLQMDTGDLTQAQYLDAVARLGALQAVV